MGNLRWPSFIIQGIILATSVSFILGGKSNIWLILSVFVVLVLFSLQTTSERWIYLFPVREDRPTVGIDTHILRSSIAIALLLLFMGISETLTSKLPDYFTIILAIVAPIFLLVMPILCSKFINCWIKRKAIDKYFWKHFKIEAEKTTRVVVILNNGLTFVHYTQKTEVDMLKSMWEILSNSDKILSLQYPSAIYQTRAIHNIGFSQVLDE